MNNFYLKAVKIQEVFLSLKSETFLSFMKEPGFFCHSSHLSLQPDGYKTSVDKILVAFQDFESENVDIKFIYNNLLALLRVFSTLYSTSIDIFFFFLSPLCASLSSLVL